MKSTFTSNFIGLLYIAVLCIPFGAHCQETICGTLADTVKTGKTIYQKSPLLDTLLKRTVQKNKENPTIEGYRIQIHYGSNRQKARRIEKNFEQSYPGHDADLIYEQPYFKIRIGKFRNKIEAHKLYYEIKKDFSSAFIVPDEIELPEL